VQTVDRMYTLTVPQTFTTVKVTTAVRDDLNALAADQGCTAGSMIEKLLAEYRWRMQVEEAKRAMRNAPKDVWDSYLNEMQEWDVTLGDGLEAEPWQS
jgi:hypothetical protein